MLGALERLQGWRGEGDPEGGLTPKGDLAPGGAQDTGSLRVSLGRKNPGGDDTERILERWGAVCVPTCVCAHVCECAVCLGMCARVWEHQGAGPAKVRGL